MVTMMDLLIFLETKLFLGNDWWSVLGLGLDIAGFAILAWDLFPEYNMMGTWRTLDRFYGLVVGAARAHYNGEADESTPTTEEIGSEIRAFFDNGHAHKIMRLTVTPNRQTMPSPPPPPPPPNDDWGKQFEWVEDMNDLSKDARTGLAARRRPPIYLAVVLIFLGFLLQAWGSIPIAQFQSELSAIEAVLPLPPQPIHTPAFSTGRIGGT